MYFDTSANKMKVYNGTTSTWDDVASVGNFYINTISSSSNTGGGSATFNGSAYRFTLSNAPTSAQQLIVSVNGVIQKPNAGSSQPSEGFAISGNDIIFAAAPASGSDYFIVTQGSSVSIGTPSDNTVATAKIQNLAVTNAKIANDTIAEGKLDVHNAPASGKYLKYTSNGMEWADGASEGTDVKSTGESGTTKFLRVDGDGTCSWQVPPDTNTVYTHPDHSGEVTSSADGAQTIASNVVDEDNLKVSNSPTNGQFLQAQSGNTGGLTWADVSSSPTIEATASGSIAAGKAVVINSSGQVKQPAQTFTAEDPVDASSAVSETSNDAGGYNTTDNVWDHTRAAYDPVTGRAMFPWNWAGSTSKWTAGTIKATDTADVWVVGSEFSHSSDKQAVWNIGENKFLIYYYSSSHARLRVITLSGTGDSITVSQGVDLTLNNQNGSSPAFANMGGGLGVLALHDQGNSEYRTYVLQVANSGTGTSVTASSIQTLADHPEGDIKIMKHSGGKVVAMWKENNDGTRSIKTRVGSVSSGDTSVTWGTEQTALSGNYSVRMTEAQTGANGEIIMMYDVSQQNIKYKIGTLSGTSISWGSEQTVIAGSATSNYHSFRDCCWDNSSGRVAILYSKTDSRVNIASASLSSGTLTKNSNHQQGVTGITGSSWPRVDEGWLVPATKTGNVLITARARQSGNNNRALLSTTATIGSIGTELTTLEYVGISSAAYTNGQTATIDVTGGTNTAVSGLTPGSKYYVQGDGSLSTDTATPLIKAGLAISATKLLVKE